ncbi:MAG TPA: hypothetical protein VGU67_03360, partial [Edaphobacter sp.]|nr:hypothetical protein [Edaphobacter sp.]
GDAAFGVRLVSLTQTLWAEMQLLAERRRWLELAEARIDETTPPGTRARLRLAAGRARHVGERRYLGAALEARELFRQVGDPLHVGMATIQAGRLLLRPGDIAEAEPYLHEAVALLRPFGPTKFLVSALESLFVMSWFACDLDGARVYVEELHDMALGLGYAPALENITILRSELLFVAGRRDEAISRARDAQAAWRKGGRANSLASSSRNLAGYLLATGDAAGGRAAACEALRLTDGAHSVAVCIQHLALAAAVDGDAICAAHLAGYADAYFQAENLNRESIEQSLWLDLCARLEQALPPDQLTALLDEGAAWSEDEAMTVALSTNQSSIPPVATLPVEIPKSDMPFDFRLSSGGEP